VSGVVAAPARGRPPQPARPPIVLLDSEAEALTSLALAALERSSLSAGLLLEELERAEIVPPGKLPADVATMRARVAFRDEATGEEHAVRLVFPKEADIALGDVSVLTPIGAALIGMRRGAAIDWPNRHGECRRLRITEVTQPSVET
jgi:regulator of nucleoside diphosphate kinase